MAMIAVAGLQLKGIHIYEYKQLAIILSEENIVER